MVNSPEDIRLLQSFIEQLRPKGGSIVLTNSSLDSIVLKKRKKIVGNGFTGNQMYRFFRSVYFNDMSQLPDGYSPLDKDNEKLYNEGVKVFYNNQNLHIVVVHNGTREDSLDDWINNVRNIFVKTPFLISNRNLRAKEAYLELKRFIQNIYTHPGSNHKYKEIKDYMETIRVKSVQQKIKLLFQHKLSSIGHSQGAVYSYLYGKQGNEIIVYNPSPIYSEIVPKNSLVIRHKNDIVSWLSPYKNKHEIQEKNDAPQKDGMMSSHQLYHLKKDATIYGNKKLYTKETHHSIKQKNIKIPQNKTKKKKKRFL